MAYLETIMLVALGFAFASLIALFLLRAVWHHGEQTGRRRVQAQFPTTSEELRADRARLRAENAMLVRRTELQIGDFKRQLAERDAEIAGLRTRVDDLSHGLYERDDQIGKLRVVRAPLEHQLEERTEALQGLQRTTREYLDQIQRLTREVEAKQASVKERDRVIAELKRALRGETTAAATDDIEIPDNLTTAQRHLRERIRTITELSREIAHQREAVLGDESRPHPEGSTPGSAAAAGSARLAEELDEAERAADQLKSDLEQLDTIWQRKQREKALEQFRPLSEGPLTAAPPPTVAEAPPPNKDAGSSSAAAAEKEAPTTSRSRKTDSKASAPAKAAKKRKGKAAANEAEGGGSTPSPAEPNQTVPVEAGTPKPGGESADTASSDSAMSKVADAADTPSDGQPAGDRVISLAERIRALHNEAAR